MNIQFLLFVIAILLVLIFWELSKINSRLKKTLVLPPDVMKDNVMKDNKDIKIKNHERKM